MKAAEKVRAQALLDRHNRVNPVGAAAAVQSQTILEGEAAGLLTLTKNVVEGRAQRRRYR